MTKINIINSQPKTNEISCHIEYQYLENSSIDSIIELIKNSVSKNINNCLISISNNLNTQHFDVKCVIESITWSKSIYQNNIYKMNIFLYSENELIGTLSKIDNSFVANQNQFIQDIFINHQYSKPNISVEDVEDFICDDSSNFYLQTYITLGIESLNQTQHNIKKIFDNLKSENIFSVKNSHLNKINVEYVIGNYIKWSLVTFDKKDNVAFSFYYDIADNSRNTILKSMIDCNIINKKCIDNDVLNGSFEDIFQLSKIYDY